MPQVQHGDLVDHHIQQHHIILYLYPLLRPHIQGAYHHLTDHIAHIVVIVEADDVQFRHQEVDHLHLIIIII